MIYNDLNWSLPVLIVLLLEKKFDLPWGTNFEVERANTVFKYHDTGELRITFDTSEICSLELTVEKLPSSVFSIYLGEIRIILQGNTTKIADICFLDMQKYEAQKVLLDLYKRLLDLSASSDNSKQL